MSHEIRTPLTAIIGFAEVLNRKDSNEEDRAYVGQSIIRNGHHLHPIINDVLDPSKIESGKLEIGMLPVSVMELVSEAEAAAKCPCPAERPRSNNQF